MIEIRGLRHAAGDFVLAVPRLTFAAQRYTVVLGPSGSGKSMLLRAVTGLLRPAEGAIGIAGRDVTALPPERRRIGFVAQEPALFPHLSVRENVAYGLKVNGATRAERERRVGELVEAFGLGALLERPVPSLSGGEAQRVALARALALLPRVLLLDEPLGHVDREARGALVQELRRVHGRERLTTVHVTHDPEEARALADDYAVMRAGRVERCYPADEPPASAAGAPAGALAPRR